MKELALNILDIVQNSITAKANRIEIMIEENTVKDFICITITDNGNGISKDLLGKVLDPYVTSRTTRKVGLGLPLLDAACRLTGGNLRIDSAEGIGTTVTASLGLQHIDRQPMGDISGVIVILLCANPEIYFNLHYKKNGNEFTFNSKEVNEILEGVPVSNPEVVKFLREMLKSNLEEL